MIRKIMGIKFQDIFTNTFVMDHAGLLSIVGNGQEELTA